MMDKAELRAALKKAEAKPMSCVVGLDGQGQAVILLDRHKGPRKLLAEVKARGRAENLDLDPASLRRGRVSVSGDEVAYALNKAAPPPLKMAMKVPMRAAGHPKFTVNADPSIEDEPDEEVDGTKGAGTGEADEAGASAPSAAASDPAMAAAAPGTAAAPPAPPTGPAPTPVSGPVPGPIPTPGPPAPARASPPHAPLSAVVPPDVAEGIRAAMTADPSRRPELVRLLAQARAGVEGGDPAAAGRGLAALRRAVDGPAAAAEQGGPKAPAPPGGGDLAAPAVGGPAPPSAPAASAKAGDGSPGADALREELRDIVARVRPAIAADPSRKGPLLKLAKDAGDHFQAGDLAGTKAGVEALRQALPPDAVGQGDAAKQGGPSILPARGPDLPADLPPLLGGSPAASAWPAAAAPAPGPSRPPSAVPRPGQRIAPSELHRYVPSLLADIRAVKPGDDTTPLHQRIDQLFGDNPGTRGHLHSTLQDLADPRAQSEQDRAEGAAGLEDGIGEGEMFTPEEAAQRAATRKERMGRAIGLAAGKLPGGFGDKLRELAEPRNLAIVLAMSGVFVALQSVPAGWLLDALLAAGLVLVAGLTAAEVIGAVKHVVAFYSLVKDPNGDLDKAADHLVDAATTLGVDVLVALVLHKAGGIAKNMPRGGEGGPPMGMQPAMAGGGRVPVPQAGAAAEAGAAPQAVTGPGGSGLPAMMAHQKADSSEPPPGSGLDRGGAPGGDGGPGPRAGGAPPTGADTAGTGVPGAVVPPRPGAAAPEPPPGQGGRPATPPIVRTFGTFEEFAAAANAPEANSTYKWGSYTWETDALGRTVRAEGKVEVQAFGRNDPKLQQDIGRNTPGRQEGDIGFHLIGDGFNAPTVRVNVLPGNGVSLDGLKSLNLSAYKKFENTVRSLASRPGANVEMRVEAVYNTGNATRRPDLFRASYREDGGRWITERFPNKPQ